MWCITIKIRAISKFWIFRVYASFENFHSSSRNIQNFDMALIFIVMHHMSSYISINSRNTLDSCRMGFFLPFFPHFSDFFHIFLRAFFHSEVFFKIKKYPLKTVKKRPHHITVQCIMRIYRYIGAHVMYHNKNKSDIKILNIPCVC